MAFLYGDYVASVSSYKMVTVPLPPPAPVVVGVGGHAGIGGVVDVEQAVFAVIVVAEPAVEGEVAVVIVGIGGAADPKPPAAIYMSKSELNSSLQLSLLPRFRRDSDPLLCSIMGSCPRYSLIIE
jgi:hypothetical protein